MKSRKNKNNPKPDVSIQVDGEKNVVANKGIAISFGDNWTSSVGILIIVALFLGVVLWFVIPQKVTMPAGKYNIAVSEILVEDTNGRPISSRDGKNLAAYIEQEINVQFHSIDPSQIRPYATWGPEQIGKLPKFNESSARERAEEINANILFYGKIVADGINSHLYLRFYINNRSFVDATEITGDQEIGKEGDFGKSVPVTIPFDDSLAPITNRPLTGMLHAMNFITIGLSYYSMDDFETAVKYFTYAINEPDWQNKDGKEVAYLLLGNSYMRLMSRDQNSFDVYLPLADEKYKEALKINPNYGRGMMGQANVKYFEALNYSKNQCLTVDLQKLKDAENLTQEVLNLVGQPESYNLQSKAYFNIGQIDLARFWSNDNSKDWLEKADSQFKLVTDDYEGGDETIKSLAAYAYFREGIIAYYQNDANTAIQLMKDKSIPIASPYYQASFSAVLGDVYKAIKDFQNAQNSYEVAINLASQYGYDTSLYQTRLDNLNETNIENPCQR